MKLFTTFLYRHLFSCSLSEQRGPCLAAGNAEMEKAFQGHKGAASLSSICSNQAGLRGDKIGLQSISSPPLTPYLSNLTKERRMEGNKRQSHIGIQKWHMNTRLEGI
ncbi:BTB (POZ) domain containing 9 [Platysternon megacephalum]|uniref:BTB (POZ) domain containing 9 n=1 Tax=Platysternon megacephalum TaxID=55544 RepID=A0A4D9EQ25_9SAUR|nr:BTB (POZ) domain containing 9 [Platysternon megacephalum]